MQLTSRDLTDGAPIDPRFAFGRYHATEHMTLSDNLSPHLRWSDIPEGIRSFALLCMDPDVPAVADDVNQPGKTIPADLERVNFCHWVMIDMPPAVTELPTGYCSQGVTPRGKQSPPGPDGTRQGLNDYTHFMAGDPDMRGQYYGYDGPCPPWNDERLHHYRFQVFALAVPNLAVPEAFSASDVLKAMEGHVLADATLTGTYTLNPAVG